MSGPYSINQAAAAASTSPNWINQAIKRKFFKPEDNPEAGKARKFSFLECMVLTLLVDLIRGGMDAEWSGNQAVFGAAHLIRGFKDDQTWFVAWYGPRQGAAGEWFFDPSLPPQHELVRGADYLKFVNDPFKYSIISVNLDHLEKRVEAALRQAQAE